MIGKTHLYFIVFVYVFFNRFKKKIFFSIYTYVYYWKRNVSVIISSEKTNEANEGPYNTTVQGHERVASFRCLSALRIPQTELCFARQIGQTDGLKRAAEHIYVHFYVFASGMNIII